FTLILGEKSGLSTSYAQFFNLFPLLLVDYRDSIQKNDAGQVRVDRRTRRLAFTSLNKGDNWIHYRATQYDDYINVADSYTEAQLQLGLIDNLDRRKWVDLTNWIKISADGQLTKHNTRGSGTDFEEYDLNLFTIATRRTWEIRNFANY